MRGDRFKPEIPHADTRTTPRLGQTEFRRLGGLYFGPPRPDPKVAEPSREVRKTSGKLGKPTAPKQPKQSQATLQRRIAQACSQEFTAVWRKALWGASRA